MADEEITIKIKVSPVDIDFINKIIEAYEGIALVTTENPQEGIIILRTSKGCYQDLMYILKTLPRMIEFLSDRV